MAPKFPKCVKIANQIGDRRISSVLTTIFVREKKAYMDASRIYNELIEEVHARIEERHEIIMELKKFLNDDSLNECLADLKEAEEEDFLEIGRLMQMSYGAAMRVGEKSKIIKKVRKLKWCCVVAGLLYALKVKFVCGCLSSF